MKKKSEKTFDLEFCEGSIKTFAGQRDSMLQNFRKGKEAGSKTYVRDMDQISSFRVGLSEDWAWLVRGYPSEMPSWIFVVTVTVLRNRYISTYAATVCVLC
jgi:hypothetical protein